MPRRSGRGQRAVVPYEPQRSPARIAPPTGPRGPRGRPVLRMEWNTLREREKAPSLARLIGLPLDGSCDGVRRNRGQGPTAADGAARRALDAVDAKKYDTENIRLVS